MFTYKKSTLRILYAESHFSDVDLKFESRASARPAYAIFYW